MLLGLFNSVKNLVIGLFIAFYLLASKEKRVAQFRKFRKAMLSEKTDTKVEDFIALTDRTFGGFIFGKILDSLVIGILTFVLLCIFEVSPYNMLIATFVGLTNVIPVFGPFIGAIPTFFVVLISNPGKAILFLVIILIVQQLDGNVIGPKILGDNTGISSLCVIIAIAICSAMWGVVGMIIGVPIFAVVIEMIKRMLEKRLAAKGEPTDTMAYYPADAVGNAEKDIYYEHSTLRYNYEHSKLKPRIERLHNRILSHLGRQTKPNRPASKDDTDPPPPKDGDTES
jgi:predicted PurR-regulated permease PerM